MFQTLRGAEVLVELKNDVSIRGRLVAVDQFLNIKLEDISVLEPAKYPHIASMKSIFIRGPSVRYVGLDPILVNVDALMDATRRELAAAAAGTSTTVSS